MHAAGQRAKSGNGGRSRALAMLAWVVATVVAAPREARAEGGLEARNGVRGGAVDEVEVDGSRVSWAEVAKERAPGSVELRWRVRSGEGGAAEVPSCAGRGAIVVDGHAVTAPDAGPVVVPLSGGEHVLSARLTVSGYERRIACGAPLRVGVAEPLHEGLLRVTFASPQARGGNAVVFAPPGHDAARAGALLVMPHPWNGGVWTYAAYGELVDEAATRDVVLLFPSGLGNSLYTADAEDEVMRAMDALAARVAIDLRRVSIAGASMGGAGATTIGLHRPDRFAGVTSFFGDSKYDLGTYVRAILRDEAGAHAVNALDVVDNARHVPVWLVHGEEDKVSPIAQSVVLARALGARGFAVRFDRVPGFGHSGALVAKFAREVVARASEARVPSQPARVTFRSVRAIDRGAYGVTIERAAPGDAFVDVERTEDGGVRVKRAENVRAIALAAGALGAREDAPVVRAPGIDAGVRVTWTR